MKIIIKKECTARVKTKRTKQEKCERKPRIIQSKERVGQWVESRKLPRTPLFVAEHVATLTRVSTMAQKIPIRSFKILKFKKQAS